jgi:hypothetical protein
MKKFKKHFILAAAFVGLAIAGSMMNPHQVSAAITSTFVQFVPSTPFAVTKSNGFGLPATFTVPTGKHLIIETLSVQGDVTPSGAKVEGFVNYTSGGKSLTLFVPMIFQYTTTSNNFDTYAATAAVRLYADPGTTVKFSLFTPPGGSIGTPFLTVSGYLF